MPPVQVQMGKAKELFAPWGLKPKELERLVEAGAIKTRQQGRGKGSLRLFDEQAIMEAYIAHTFRTVGFPLGRIARVMRTLRPYYREWLATNVGAVELKFAFKAFAEWVESPRLRIDLQPALYCISALRGMPEYASDIHRGRPAEDWRAAFREAVQAISGEMYGRGITEEDIDAAIEQVRKERRGRKHEGATVCVTVPPS